jgi:CheR methyltransferase, SAM binding domain
MADRAGAELWRAGASPAPTMMFARATTHFIDGVGAELARPTIGLVPTVMIARATRRETAGRMMAGRANPTPTLIVVAALLTAAAHTDPRVERVKYSDLPAPIQKHFTADGIPEEKFAGYLHDVDMDTERRVAEGEREHLVYYALQSKRFTRLPPIEPAASARRFVQALTPVDRQLLLDDAGFAPASGWPAAERARVAAALGALARNTADARLSSFSQLRAAGGGALSLDALYPDYVRIVRFLYRKEFASAGTAAEVAALYQTRPHSSDSQIEAGFGVYLGLGTLHALEPAQRVRRVLVVGPGLDVAPRTDLIDAVGPQMYQPFAVADALLALAMSSETDLAIESVDVNPRVVRFVRRLVEMTSRQAPVLHLFTGITETGGQPFSADYREYVRALGRAIGEAATGPADIAADRRYQHSIAVRPAVARLMRADRLNIVTERLNDEHGFDLVVITNVLTYFDDRQLALALSNLSAMLRPGGWLLHNEARAGLADTAARMQLPVVQMRTAVLGGSKSRPWYDTVWLHQKTRS